MVAKKYAISTPSAAIALRYGANVSRGIQGMDHRIKMLEITAEAYEGYMREHPAIGPSVRKLKQE